MISQINAVNGYNIQDLNSQNIENLNTLMSLWNVSDFNTQLNLIKKIYTIISTNISLFNQNHINWYYKKLDVLKHYCCIDNCGKKRGLFPVCTDHFDKCKYCKNNKTYIWCPPEEGYKTIKKIANDYPMVIDINNIKVEDINGKNTKITINCYICDYQDNISLSHIFSIKGAQCKSCYGKWTINRVHQECLKRPDINFNRLTTDCIITNVKSMIPISCNILGCGYKTNASINNIFNEKSNCRRCVGKEIWTLERLYREALNRPELNFTLVTENDMVHKSQSHIPIYCNICNYGIDEPWRPVINDIFNSDSGCPQCSDRHVWNWIRFQKEIINKPNIDFSKVVEEDILGANSKINVICKNDRCNYTWPSTITSIFNQNTGCPKCSNNVPWTYQKLQDERYKQPTIDFSQVTEKDINDGKNSKIPVICLICEHSDIRIITKILKNGCRKCSNREPWTIERLHRESLNKPLINFSLITEQDIVKGVYSRITISCYACSYLWNPTICAIFHHNYGCLACAKCQPWTYERFTIEKLKILYFNFDKVTEKHINQGVDSNLTISCILCNYEFDRTIDRIFNNKYGCPKCNKHEPWTYNKLQTEKYKRPDLKFNHVLEEDINNGGDSVIIVKCVVCKDKFERTLFQIFQGCNCIKCNLYKGPKSIALYMINNGISYIAEKTFPFLRNVNLLRIDIYIPNQQDVEYPICIEYDGNYPGSHFNNYYNHKDKESHIQSIKRDTIKDNIIIENGMHLLRIPYTAFPKENQEKMNTVLEKSLNYLKTCNQPTLYRVNPETYLLRDTL